MKLACSSNTLTSNTPPLPPSTLASAARFDTMTVSGEMHYSRILRRAAPRHAAASASTDGMARQALPGSQPAGRTGPRCCPQLALAAACASAPCPARAPARQPRHYSDLSLSGRLGTQRRAGAVWRLGPARLSLMEARLATADSVPRPRALSYAAPRALQAPRSACRPPGDQLSQPPAPRPPACPSTAAPRRLSPISAIFFPAMCRRTRRGACATVRSDCSCAWPVEC